MVDFQRVYKDLSEIKLGAKSITQNGTYSASSDNLDGYNSVTVNMSSGSGNIAKIKVIDLDGTVIDWKWCKEGDTYTLPTPPTHPCLTFHEWVSSRPITNNTITVGKADVTIGAVYKPTSSNASMQNKLVLVLRFFEADSTVIIGSNKAGGDFYVDANLFNDYNGILTYTNILNDGENLGKVSFTATAAGDYYVPVVYSTILPYFTNVNIGYLVDITYIESVVGLILPPLAQGNGTLSFRCGFLGTKYAIPANDISQCLEFVGLPCNATTITMNPSSYGCRSPHLKVIITPSSVVNGYAYSIFNITRDINSPNLKDIIANCKIYGNEGNATTASHLGYSSMESFHIDKSNAFLGGWLFYHCENCLEYDFTDFTSVPTLQNVNAFEGINDHAVIKVPASLESDWKSATNWVTYAKYIVGV